ncbi:ubiquitin-like polyubiquitin-binding protein [Fimicolochytrium jonesii]|uniref:ubiquitin-like polyubiquitin-binding protein n=1 Tax=Fimicolochytrium jonesii TaxID=1396493 RepID=UPI0022FDFE8A|nr:ubiquitin-like polyubiquitin-binding protein [Fimicolochytrium jonesii]KAI8822896.1 ubiquitin-like polyubiquitin-binding protein [Fimicolochytrium jonesii]
MPEINIKIKQANETAFSVSINTTASVADLKQKIADHADVPTTQQRLIFAGKVMKDEEKIETYKMQDGNTVHMVKGSAPASRSAPTPGGATAAASTTPAASTATSPSTANPAAANPFNMFGGPGAAGGLGGAGGNPFAAFGGGGMGGMGGGGDPSAMINAMLSNPAVSASVAQMMSNPQVLDQLAAANPAMAGMITPQMREMMNSPQFRSMMSNPAVLQQAMQMLPLMGAMNGGGAGGAGAAGNPLAGIFGGANPDAARSAASPGAGAGASPLMNPALMQMLMGGAGGFGAPAAPADTRPPEERFQEQLRQLQEMGFFSAAENIAALTATGGNVEAAVEYLFSRPRGY